MHRNTPQLEARSLQRGFTLVESLVAMVVISVGMLGIAAMYVEGLRAGRTSMYRSTAVELASDMADRIRSSAINGTAYATGGGGVALVIADLNQWNNVLRARLPEGAATIARVDGNRTDAYTITIRWREPGVTAPIQYTLAVRR